MLVDSVKAWEFTAEKIPVRNSYGCPAGSPGILIPDHYQIRKTAEFGHENLGTCGKQYEIVQHKDIITTVESALDDMGLKGFKRNVRLLGENGSRMVATYTFREEITKDIKQGDSVGFRLEARNSYDGKWRYHMVGGGLRLICLNGMVGMDRESQVGWSGKHTTSLAMDVAREEIQKLIKLFEKDVSKMQNMAEKTFSHVQGLHLLEHLTAKLQSDAKKDSTLFKNLASIWEAPSYELDGSPSGTRNLWQSYNCATQHARDVEAGSTNKKGVERWEQSDKQRLGISRFYNGLLRDASKFQAALEPSCLPERERPRGGRVVVAYSGS
jgi:hypothetical protein